MLCFEKKENKRKITGVGFIKDGHNPIKILQHKFYTVLFLSIPIG